MTSHLINWRRLVILVVCCCFAFGGTFTCTSGSDKIGTNPATPGK
ncbi:MAG: hypothetical protein ABIP55_09850 [Tepidisphaeraceae bacterium]